MTAMDGQPSIDVAIAQIATRLRRIREKRNITLAELSKSTGISKSTLSRLESDQRKPSLELLLPIAAALHVTLDDIVAAPRVADPRVQRTPHQVNGRTILPLTNQPGREPRAYKIIIPASENEPLLRSHAGNEWLYVLSGKLRLVLGDHDVVLGPGEVAEFNTEHPHWFGSTGRGVTEIFSLFGKDGERMHIRARSTGAGT